MASKFAVLYTHQKTKKRKVWQDGTLTLSNDGKKADLKNEAKEMLATVYIKKQYFACNEYIIKVLIGDDLECAKYLIQVDDVICIESSASTQSTQGSQYLSQQTPATINTSDPAPRHVPVFSQPVRKRTKFSIPRKITDSQDACKSETKWLPPSLAKNDPVESDLIPEPCNDENGIWSSVVDKTQQRIPSETTKNADGTIVRSTQQVLELLNRAKKTQPGHQSAVSKKSAGSSELMEVSAVVDDTKGPTNKENSQREWNECSQEERKCEVLPGNQSQKVVRKRAKRVKRTQKNHRVSEKTERDEKGMRKSEISEVTLLETNLQSPFKRKKLDAQKDVLTKRVNRTLIFDSLLECDAEKSEEFDKSDFGKFGKEVEKLDEILKNDASQHVTPPKNPDTVMHSTENAPKLETILDIAIPDFDVEWELDPLPKEPTRPKISLNSPSDVAKKDFYELEERGKQGIMEVAKNQDLSLSRDHCVEYDRDNQSTENADGNQNIYNDVKETDVSETKEAKTLNIVTSCHQNIEIHEDNRINTFHNSDENNFPLCVDDFIIFEIDKLISSCNGKPALSCPLPKNPFSERNLLEVHPLDVVEATSSCKDSVFDLKDENDLDISCIENHPQGNGTYFIQQAEKIPQGELIENTGAEMVSSDVPSQDKNRIKQSTRSPMINSHGNLILNKDQMEDNSLLNLDCTNHLNERKELDEKCISTEPSTDGDSEKITVLLKELVDIVCDMSQHNTKGQILLGDHGQKIQMKFQTTTLQTEDSFGNETKDSNRLELFQKKSTYFNTVDVDTIYDKTVREYSDNREIESRKVREISSQNCHGNGGKNSQDAEILIDEENDNLNSTLLVVGEANSNKVCKKIIEQESDNIFDENDVGVEDLSPPTESLSYRDSKAINDDENQLENGDSCPLPDFDMGFSQVLASPVQDNIEERSQLIEIAALDSERKESTCLAVQLSQNNENSFKAMLNDCSDEFLNQIEFGCLRQKSVSSAFSHVLTDKKEKASTDERNAANISTLCNAQHLHATHHDSELSEIEKGGRTEIKKEPHEMTDSEIMEMEELDLLLKEAEKNHEEVISYSPLSSSQLAACSNDYDDAGMIRCDMEEMHRIQASKHCPEQYNTISKNSSETAAGSKTGNCQVFVGSGMSQNHPYNCYDEQYSGKSMYDDNKNSGLNWNYPGCNNTYYSTSRLQPSRQLSSIEERESESYYNRHMSYSNYPEDWVLTMDCPPKSSKKSNRPKRVQFSSCNISRAKREMEERSFIPKETGKKPIRDLGIPGTYQQIGDDDQTENQYQVQHVPDSFNRNDEYVEESVEERRETSHRCNNPKVEALSDNVSTRYNACSNESIDTNRKQTQSKSNKNKKSKPSYFIKDEINPAEETLFDTFPNHCMLQDQGVHKNTQCSKYFDHSKNCPESKSLYKNEVKGSQQTLCQQLSNKSEVNHSMNSDYQRNSLVDLNYNQPIHAPEIIGDKRNANDDSLNAHAVNNVTHSRKTSMQNICQSLREKFQCPSQKKNIPNWHRSSTRDRGEIYTRNEQIFTRTGSEIPVTSRVNSNIQESETTSIDLSQCDMFATTQEIFCPTQPSELANFNRISALKRNARNRSEERKMKLPLSVINAITNEKPKIVVGPEYEPEPLKYNIAPSKASQSTADKLPSFILNAVAVKDERGDNFQGFPIHRRMPSHGITEKGYRANEEIDPPNRFVGRQLQNNNSIPSTFDGFNSPFVKVREKQFISIPSCNDKDSLDKYEMKLSTADRISRQTNTLSESDQNFVLVGPCPNLSTEDFEKPFANFNIDDTNSYNTSSAEERNIFNGERFQATDDKSIDSSIPPTYQMRGGIIQGLDGSGGSRWGRFLHDDLYLPIEKLHRNKWVHTIVKEERQKTCHKTEEEIIQTVKQLCDNFEEDESQGDRFESLTQFPTGIPDTACKVPQWLDKNVDFMRSGSTSSNVNIDTTVNHMLPSNFGLKEASYFIPSFNERNEAFEKHFHPISTPENSTQYFCHDNYPSSSIMQFIKPLYPGSSAYCQNPSSFYHQDPTTSSLFQPIHSLHPGAVQMEALNFKPTNRRSQHYSYNSIFKDEEANRLGHGMFTQRQENPSFQMNIGNEKQNFMSVKR